MSDTRADELIDRFDYY